MAPKLSIITSLYKGEKFIAGFLADIVRQTYFDRSELLIVNANSPENEDAVIQPYLSRYPNIRYYRLRSDPGIYSIWNFAITQSSGEYISNANVDDRKHVEHLARHAQLLDENPDIDLAYADAYATEVPNEVFENCTISRIVRFPEFSYDDLVTYNMPHNNPVWRKSMHVRFGLFREDMYSAADFEMWLRAAAQGSVFKRIPEVLSLYYANPEGISTRPDRYDLAITEVRRLQREYRKIKPKGR